MSARWEIRFAREAKRNFTGKSLSGDARRLLCRYFHPRPYQS